MRCDTTPFGHIALRTIQPSPRLVILMPSDAAAESGQQQAKAKVFISCSRKDMAFANRLEAALRQRGFEPLIDRTDIYAFEEWSFGFGEPKKPPTRRPV
jgi:TIR domain